MILVRFTQSCHIFCALFAAGNKSFEFSTDTKQYSGWIYHYLLNTYRVVLLRDQYYR